MHSKLEPGQRDNVVRAVFHILNEWHTSPEQQAVLLGLPQDTRIRALNRYRAGQAFPEEVDFLERAELLFSIVSAVNSIHPHNPHAANLWISTGNMFLGDRSPLDIMLARGLSGMQSVLDHLNGETY